VTSHPPSVTPVVSVPLGSLGKGLGPPHGLTGNAGSVIHTFASLKVIYIFEIILTF